MKNYRHLSILSPSLSWATSRLVSAWIPPVLGSSRPLVVRLQNLYQVSPRLYFPLPLPHLVFHLIVTITLWFRQGRRVPTWPSSYTQCWSGSVKFGKDNTGTPAAELLAQHFYFFLIIHLCHHVGSSPDSRFLNLKHNHATNLPSNLGEKAKVGTIGPRIPAFMKNKPIAWARGWVNGEDSGGSKGSLLFILYLEIWS